MTKIVINACHGGFGLSHAGLMAYADRKGFSLYPFRLVRGDDGRMLGLDKIEPIPEAEVGSDLFTSYYTTPDAQTGTLFSCREIERTDPDLIAVVESMGNEASGKCARLAVEDIPPGTLYRIDEYDGYESIEYRDWIEWRTA